MRRALPLATLLLALAAWALPVDRGIVEDGTDSSAANGTTDGGVVLVVGNGTTRLRPATCAASSCTRVAPDAGAEGISMEDVAACRLMVCGPGDQTLVASGTMELWARDPATGFWAWMAEKDKTITKTVRCQAFGVELNGMQAADVRLLYRPNGVGVSGNDGGSLITSLQCCRRGPVPLGNTGQNPGCGP